MKPRVLFLAQLPPPVHGASVMNKTIVDSAIVNQALSLDVINISTAEAISDIGKASLKKYLKFLKLWWSVFRRLLAGRHELVYLTLSPHGAAFVKDALLALTARILGKTCLYHLHGKGIKAEYAKGGWRRWLYDRVFAGAEVIHLAPSLYAADIAAIVPASRVHFLPNGVNSLFEDVVTDDGLPPKILYLSNMVPSKGARVLLEAAKRLADQGLRFEVDFAGNWGTDPRFREDFLRYIEDNRLGDCVRYLGPQYGEEKRRLLNSADIFTLPTYFRNECFPLAILEAMSCGLPIVSTYEGAIPDIVRENVNGLLVTQESVDELAAALRKLLEEPALRRRLGERARALYQENYTVAAFERNFVAIVETVLKRQARPS